MGYDAGPRYEPPVDLQHHCTPENPVYDPTAQYCVPCTASNSGACTPGIQVCGTLSGSPACVECNTNADCKAPLTCDLTASACTLSCLLDAGVCGPNNFCDLDAGSCAYGCRTNADCASPYPVCHTDGGGTGSCDQCDVATTSGAGSCGAGMVCSQAMGNVCNFDCRADGGACAPGYCDADGGSGPVCQSGCFTSSNCDAQHPVCLGAANGLPGTCSECSNDLSCASAGHGYLNCDPQFNFCDNNCWLDAGSGIGRCGGSLQCLVDPSNTSTGATCGCYTDQECNQASRGLTPTCLPVNGPLDAGAGVFGACGCNATSECPSGEVCETRTGNFAGSFNSAGVCMPACSDGGTNCASASFNLPVCNPATGYCVGCATSSDCSQSAGVPVCTAAPDSGFPFAGDGTCDCTATSQCNNNNMCSNNSFGFGQFCAAACTYDGGTDSCGGLGSTTTTPLCNTFTGACVTCLDNYGCTNGGAGYDRLATHCLLDAGACVQCFSSSNCGATTPGCQASTLTCGFCDNQADCPADAGIPYQCEPTPFVTGTSLCVVGCTPDGGSAQCPAAQPLCDPAAAVCVQCELDGDCPAHRSCSTVHVCL